MTQAAGSLMKHTEIQVVVMEASETVSTACMKDSILGGLGTVEMREEHEDGLKALARSSV